VLIETGCIGEVKRKSALIREQLRHPLIKAIHGTGLLLAVEYDNPQLCSSLIAACIENGLFTDWFLFAPHCLRIAPPLLITDDEILEACRILNSCMDKVQDSLSA
jgi:acetylornithine/succinyldiaminopimelate/putrescine aminotransferase